MKKLLRREKKEMMRKTLKKIENRGEPAVNYSGQIWLEEKGREGAYQDCKEQDGTSSRKPGGSGRGTSQALGGVEKKERE